jgi:hypothetical protein
MSQPPIVRGPRAPAAAAAGAAPRLPRYEAQWARVELVGRGLRAPVPGRDGPVYVVVRFDCVTEIYVTVAAASVFYERCGQPCELRVVATSPGWGDVLLDAHARWMSGGAAPAAPAAHPFPE